MRGERQDLDLALPSIVARRVRTAPDLRLRLRFFKPAQLDVGWNRAIDPDELVMLVQMDRWPSDGAQLRARVVERLNADYVTVSFLDFRLRVQGCTNHLPAAAAMSIDRQLYDHRMEAEAGDAIAGLVWAKIVSNKLLLGIR